MPVSRAAREEDSGKISANKTAAATSARLRMQ
jgi:hypothetical protein